MRLRQWMPNEGVEGWICYGDDAMFQDVNLSRKELNIRQQLLKGCILDHAGMKHRIHYDADGKPFLDDAYVSISHSGLCAAVVRAGFPVGLDVQRKDERLHTLYPKFVHAKEEDFFSMQNDMDLLRLWTAKEAVYKLAGIRGLSFKEQILIHPLEEGQGRGWVSYPGRSVFQVALRWMTEGDYTFCIALRPDYK